MVNPAAELLPRPVVCSLKRIFTVTGLVNVRGYTAIAALMVFSIVAACGSLVMDTSKVGTIVNPAGDAAVVKLLMLDHVPKSVLLPVLNKCTSQ